MAFIRPLSDYPDTLLVESTIPELVSSRVMIAWSLHDTHARILTRNTGGESILTSEVSVELTRPDRRRLGEPEQTMVYPGACSRLPLACVIPDAVSDKWRAAAEPELIGPPMVYPRFKVLSSGNVQNNALRILHTKVVTDAPPVIMT